MSKYFANLNSSGANPNPLTIATGSQISASQVTPVSPYQSSHYYIPNSYEIKKQEMSECFLNRNDGFSNKSSTISTVKEAPFNQPCQISVESEYNKVSQVIDNCFANNPVQKESLLNSLKAPSSFNSNNQSTTYPKQVLQVSKKNNIVTPLDLPEKNLGNLDFGKQLLTPNGFKKLQSQELSNISDLQQQNKGYKDSLGNQQLKRHSTSSNAEEINYSQAIQFDQEFSNHQMSSNRSMQNKQANSDFQVTQQNAFEDQQLQFECIKQNLDIQIQMLENRLLEVDFVRQKYFKMMIEDLKREKEREVSFIQSLIKQNNWNQYKNMKGIDSIKRKITDIGVEMNDLKDLKNVLTKFKPSIYYDPNRASKVFNLRRSNSASQLLSYVRNKPLDLPEILEIENQSQQEREILPVARLPFYQSRHLTDYKLADNLKQISDLYGEPSIQSSSNQYLTPNKISQAGYQTQQAEDQQKFYSYQTPTNLMVENNAYYPQDLNAISSNKSQSSSTPYSKYAEKQNDQKSWFNDSHLQEKEINLDQYKKVVPSYNRHQRNQSLYTQKTPFYENKNNEFNMEMYPNKIDNLSGQQINYHQQIPLAQVQEAKDLLNNKDSQIHYKLNPPFNFEDKFNQSLSQTTPYSNHNKIQNDLEREESQQQEEKIKRAPQNNLPNTNYQNEEKLEESVQSNKPWTNIMSSQKKKLTESNHSSRYSACNEDSQKDQELESNQYNSIVQQNYQEPRFYHCKKFNSDQKNNKSNINNIFLSNKKLDDHKEFCQNMPEIAYQNNIKTNQQQFYCQPEQNEQVFYHQTQNPEQQVKDYQIHNKHFENIIQSVKLNAPDGYQQGYFPSERVETARFENLNDIQSRKGLHSQTEFNFLSAQSIDRQHENQQKSNQNQESSKKQSFENFSIKQNTPTQSNRDLDSFAHENSFQNMQNANNSLNNSRSFKDSQVQAMNNSTDKNKLQTAQNEILQGQGENVQFNYQYNPQPIRDLNSMISSQQKQDTQSFQISDQDPSMLFSTNNNNYLAQYQIDQSHTYVNQGESFFSEKDQIRASQKKQYQQNQSRGQFDFENQSVRQENLPVIEEQLQNSDESQRSSQIHYNQQQYQEEAQNILEMRYNNKQIADKYPQNTGNQISSQSYENGAQDQKAVFPFIENRFEQKNIKNNLYQNSDSDLENKQKNNAVNQRGSQSNLAVSKQSVQNMETINKIIERHITIQSSQGSEILKNAQQQNQSEKKFQESRLLYQENQTKKTSQDESSDKIPTNSKTKEQTLYEQNEFQNHSQRQQIENRNIILQNQDSFFVGNVKARIFLTDREFREYLTQKGGIQSDKQVNEHQAGNLKNSQRGEESKFAKCILIYSFNNQCLKLLFNSSLLQSLEEEQTVIDEIPVSQINIDQLDFTNLPQNKIYLKLSYKNQPSLNNKIILMQFNSNKENDDYFTQKNHLENLKNKIQLIYQLKDDPEDLNSKLIINSQPIMQNMSSQNIFSSENDVQNQRNGEGEDEQEEQKYENKYEFEHEYIPSSKRLAQGKHHKQQQQEENVIFNSIHNQEGYVNSQQEYEKQKLRTPQFQEMQCESQIYRNDNTLQSPIPFNQKEQNSFEQEEILSQENELKQKQKHLAEIMEENSEQVQQKSASYCQNQKEKQEVQIFSGFSNHDSVLKQNVVDISQRFFQNNQKQFSTIKRENEDEDVGDESQDIENNIRQFNELNPNIEDYQEDQAEFSLSQIKDQKLKQKLLQQNKYKMAQYNQRTDEEENLLKILKNFDEKFFIMKKYGQNSSNGQQRRIFFSSDFRFFCWKGLKSPELKRSFPINKFQPYIIHGRNTQNFKRFKTSNQMENDRSFSLILDDRTIDLQAESIEDKEQFIKGLQIIFNCIL